MTVLITGSTGFIGANLVRRFAAEDQVVAVDIATPDAAWRRHLGELAERVDVVTADVSTDGWWHAVPDRPYDTVIHAAAITPVTPEDETNRAAEATRVNVGGVAQVMGWAGSARPTRVIHLSSGAVYGMGPAGARSLTEDMPLAPESVYGITKVAGEGLATRLASLHDLPLTVVRLTHTFGPLERPTQTRRAMSPIYEWCAAALAGRPVSTAHPTRLRDYAYVEDVAAAVWAIAKASNTVGQTYNISSGTPYSEDETLDLLAGQVPIQRLDGGARSSAASSLRPPLSPERLARDTSFRCNADLAMLLDTYLRWLRGSTH